MNRKQRIIVSITGIFLVLLILLGLTYAYFATQIIGNKEEESISLSIANLAIVYGDGNEYVIGSDEGPILPGKEFKPKTFTVTNQGNDITDYVVVIDNSNITYATTIEINGETQTASEEATLKYNDFTYILECTSYENYGEENQIESGTCTGVSEEGSKLPVTGGILVKNTVDIGITHVYSLKVKYEETDVDQTEDMNKKIEARINIADPDTFNPYKTDKGSLAYTLIDNAIGLTNEEKTAGYAELVEKPYTKVAEEISEIIGATGYEVEEDLSMEVSTTYQSYYWTYGTNYSINQDGTFNLENATYCKYDEEGCITDLIAEGKSIYIASVNDYIENYNFTSSTSSSRNTTNLRNLFRIISADTETDKLILRRITHIPESIISTTRDEYGTSYYFRGNVENNYLEFNNMCWRIVRIEGDGSIKIVLADATAGCSTETLTKTNSAYIGTGYYGGTSNDIFQIFANYDVGDTDSMKHKFNIFLNGGEFSSYDSSSNIITKTYKAWSAEAKAKLKTTQACMGNIETVYNSSGVLMSDAEKADAIENISLYYYETYVRLYGLGQTANATLMCNASGGKISETKIFPLTADEVVFAGGKAGTNNYTYYLRNNATTNGWLTLSPAYFEGIYDYVFGVNLNGNVDFNSVTYVGDGLRPAVSLVAGTQLDSGDGTVTNPYKIKK